MQALRTAPFLTAQRARAYLAVLALGLGLVLAHGWAGVFLSRVFPIVPADLDPGQRPAPTDFLTFWSASRLALHGMPQAAYAPGPILGVERATAYMAPHDYLGFFYPPVFLLLCLPLGLLAYPAAFATFIVATAAPLMLCLRRLFPGFWLLPFLAFPPTLLNAATGQNGFLTAGCFAGAAMFMETRPVIAGVCLGGLVCKPHMALCLPVGLFVARRWHSAAAAAATAAALCAISWVVFGAPAWDGFLIATHAARGALEQDRHHWAKLFTPYAAARLLHAPIAVAYAVQAVVALAAMALVAFIARHRPGARTEIAVLTAAALVCTPYALDYDLVCLLVPAGWLASEAMAGLWLEWEKMVLVVLYLATLAGRVAGIDAGIPLGPLAVMAFLAVIGRRAWLGLSA
jgi:hypothetical protein